MDAKEIRKLLDALASTDVNELTLETGEYKLTVRRGQQVALQAQQAPAPSAPPHQPAQPAVATPQAAAPGGAYGEQPPVRSEAQSDGKAQMSEVKAPIVGTFYYAPSPDAEPYVKVGDRVERGTVLCIIEAMKLMNEIEAESAGTVAEILVRNEEPVEYGQVLFRIDPR
jgi:acetyl-CoA carboxylase biotin carboxyl carrier protein